MPRSAAGKAAREQKKLSASAAWKQGHVGGRGRGKFGGRGGGGGRGGRWGHDGRDARHRETHPDHARASARANDGDAEDDDEDDVDLDPLAAIGSGDAYSALLASLRGGSGDDPDQDYAEALAARDSDAEDSDEDDEDDENEREDGSDEANDREGRAGPTAADADDASDSDSGSDSDPDAELADADPAATAWDNRDDEADAEEGDEEDAVISDEDEDDGEAAAGGEDPSAAAATSASIANHGLATHLRRVVDADVAARLSAAPPKYKRADDDDDGGGEGDDAKSKSKSKSKSKKTTTADASGCSSAGGWWEFDRVAREDGASVRGAPSAPAALPAKLKERWNALRDPASASRAAKRARSDVKAAKGNKVAVEAAKAKAAAAAAATAPAPFASKTQAEFHALLEQYRDVVYTERATPGSIPKEPVTEDGLGGGGDDVMDAYLLHAVAHVMRTRQRVTKNNEALLRRAKAAEAELAARRAAERAAATEAAVASALASGGKEGEKAAAAGAGETPRKKPKGGRVKVEDDLPRDQGFVRPTVLILAPMRNVAGRIVRRLLQLCPAAHGRADAVNKLDRFAEDFGAGDSDEEDAGEKERRRKKGLWMPEDHAELFRGNTDDHFRLGIKVTKASVRLYVDFFGSDILVASPLGTRPAGGSRVEDRTSPNRISSFEPPPRDFSHPRLVRPRRSNARRLDGGSTLFDPLRPRSTARKETVDRRIGRAGDDNFTHRLSPAAVWPNFMFPIGPRLVPSSVPRLAIFSRGAFATARLLPFPLS